MPTSAIQQQLARLRGQLRRWVLVRGLARWVLIALIVLACVVYKKSKGEWPWDTMAEQYLVFKGNPDAIRRKVRRDREKKDKAAWDASGEVATVSNRLEVDIRRPPGIGNGKGKAAGGDSGRSSPGARGSASMAHANSRRAQ